MPSNLISVIIPAYNKEDYIAQTIESILNQTYKNFELIIVENGSTDSTPSVIEKLLPHPQIIYRTQENQGPSGGRNAGARLSQGDYLLFIDADDLIEPSYLEQVLSVFQKKPATDIVFSNAVFFGKQSGSWQNKDFSLFEILKFNRILSTVGLIKKSAWQKIGGFDLQTPGLEDWDFWISAKINKLNLKFIDEPLFRYRQLESSQNKQDNQKYWFIASYLRKKYAKHYSLNIFRLLKKHSAVGFFDIFIFWLENIFYRLLPNFLKYFLAKLKNRVSNLIPLFIIAVILGTLILSSCQTKKPLPDQACFNQNCFNLQLAITSEQKAIGLMQHENLDIDSGMLFVYDQPRNIGIWMKNMSFPIDILWLDENLNLVYFVKNAPPCQDEEPCPSYTNPTPAQYVLEIKAGLIDKFDLELGQSAEFKY